MSNALHADYLFVGPQIEARLAERIAGVPVEGVEQLAQVGAEDLRARVLFVMWAGDRFGDRAAGGGAQQVTQRWVVWLCVRNASAADKDARAKAAGALLSAAHLALAGWTPEGAFRPLRRAAGPAPTYTRTNGLLPMLFEIDLNL